MKWEPIFIPDSVEVEKDTLTDYHGKFIFGPLERGIGHSVGNALRRTLLSEIQGAAVRYVKFENVQHEFSAMEGVEEDVVQIILNIKKLAIKMYTNELQKLVIKKKGKGIITANDIIENQSVEIKNKDLYICNVTENIEFYVEIYTGTGRGYKLAEENSLDGMPLGTIPVDSLYSPIVDSKYNVEAARIGQRHDNDRLILEIETNGTISPIESLSHAAKIMKDHFERFIKFEKEPEYIEEEAVDKEQEKLKKILNKDINELELSVRASNCLRAALISTIGELVQKTESEMLKYRNFGKKSLTEIKQHLKLFDLSFGMKVEEILKNEE